MVNIRTDLTQRIQELSRIKSSTPDAILENAILEYLAREEYYERERREDLEGLEEYYKTGDCLSNDVMMKWLSDLMQGKHNALPNNKANF